MHEQYLAFMDWAESYDTARAPVRSLDLHQAWSGRLRCPLIRLHSDRPPEALMQEVLDRMPL
jgi:hypothetical protein